jgi:hypothetical protein
MMDRDPLDVIAESYRSLAETNRYIAQTQRGLARLTLVAMVPSVCGLLLLGWLAWQTLALRQEHAAQTEALRAQTQTLTAQTQALLEVLRQAKTP